MERGHRRLDGADRQPVVSGPPIEPEPPAAQGPPENTRVPEEIVARLYARQPGRMVPDLDRITLLAELLGRPDQAYPSIQVTGTNGKGSIGAMVTALLGALGLKAGTYSSPHLQDVRERIRVAGEPIAVSDFTEALGALQPYLAEIDARTEQAVSFFEVLTALAFAWFADAPVDVGVFEVGMGGTWDATNLVRGEVAALGTIGVDHPELGDTPEKVAREKLGICKPGAVIVSGQQADEVQPLVVERAQQVDGRLVQLGSDFAVTKRELAVGGQLVTLQGVTGEVRDVYVPLHGRHQADNAAIALAAVEGFLGFAGGLDADVIRNGFAAVRMPGRLEVVRRTDRSPVILDGAHNPLGAAALAEALVSEFAVRNRVVVMAMLGDKDVETVMGLLAPAIDHLVVTRVGNARTADPDRLAAAARDHGLTCETASDMEHALELASGLATAEDAVIVTGSLYAVGEARDLLGLPVT